MVSWESIPHLIFFMENRPSLSLAHIPLAIYLDHDGFEARKLNSQSNLDNFPHQLAFTLVEESIC